MTYSTRYKACPPAETVRRIQSILKAYRIETRETEHRGTVLLDTEGRSFCVFL